MIGWEIICGNFKKIFDLAARIVGHSIIPLCLLLHFKVGILDWLRSYQLLY